MVAAIVLFRSQRAENALTGEDESAIRGLLELYGKNDSLGYFATRRDKSVVFAPTGRAAITYRVEVGVCLASGDPIGDPKAWPQAIEAWLRLCQAYGWAPGGDGREFELRPGVPRGRPQRARSSATRRSCTRTTSGWRARHACGAAGGDPGATRGLTVRIRRHRDLDRRRDGQGGRAGRRLARHRDERGFSMALGRLGDPADGDCLLVEAVRRRSRRRPRSSRCCPSCRGAPTGCRWI